MTASYSKQLLSASTDGKPIKVAATSTPGTLIHTAITGSTQIDEIWIEAVNTDTVDRLLTIEYGDATAPDHNIPITIPHQTGLVLVINGMLLNNGDTVKAFAAATNVINIIGFVNRITP
jgi:hypothetical protein